MIGEPRETGQIGNEGFLEYGLVGFGDVLVLRFLEEVWESLDYRANVLEAVDEERMALVWVSDAYERRRKGRGEERERNETDQW